jgi:hypothetical protein
MNAGNFWPDASQTLLLCACLAQDEDAALAAWTQWQAATDLDSIDAGSYRLLPLLAWRLLALKQDHPLMPRLRGCLRQSWVASQHMQRTAARAAKVLADKGVPALLFKGVALDLLAYPARGLRPMLDVDIAVPRSQSDAAWDALLAAGWQPSLPRERALCPHATAVAFKHPGQGEVDLHFALFPESSDAELTQRLWDGARPIDVHQQPCLALGATDLLFQVMAHGLRANPLPPIRWVADAVWILRGGDIDWDRFLALAAQLRCRMVMERALRWLVHAQQVDLPPQVLGALRGPHGWLERIEYRYARVHGLGELVILGQYLRLNAGSNPLQRLTRWPKHLQQHWGEPSLSATARRFFVKGGRAAMRVIATRFRRVGK